MHGMKRGTVGDARGELRKVTCKKTHGRLASSFLGGRMSGGSDTDKKSFGTCGWGMDLKEDTCSGDGGLLQPLLTLEWSDRQALQKAGLEKLLEACEVTAKRTTEDPIGSMGADLCGDLETICVAGTLWWGAPADC